MIIFDQFFGHFWPNFDHFILDAIWKGHMRVESCTIFLLSLDKCREGRITSNGLWRRQAPFGLRTWGWDPSIAWNDFLRVIRGVRGVPEGVFGGGRGVTITRITNPLLFYLVLNQPFDEFPQDCSPRGLEDHRQIGRRNVCQLFSEWCFYRNSTWKMQKNIYY